MSCNKLQYNVLMNKIIMILLVSFSSYGDNLADNVADKIEVTKSDKKDKKSLIVKITKDDPNHLEAEIVESKKNIKLIGKKESKEFQLNGTVIHQIKWDRIAEDSNIFDLKEPYLSMPITASANDINIGDQMRAVGTPDHILEIIETKDQAKQNLVNTKDSTKDLNSNDQQNNGISSLNNDNQNLQMKFREKKKVGSTTEGCTIRIDTNSMLAIQQTRRTLNGKIDGICTDSSQRYDLHKNYDVCPLNIDSSDDYAYRQYKLYYNIDGGKEIEASSCTSDSSNKYKIQSVTSGCSPILDVDRPIIQKRRIVDINGYQHEISSCAPDDSQDVASEICEDKLFTHDFENNISRINKKFFYYDGEKKKYLKNGDCLATNNILPHEDITSGCKIEHDDFNLKTSIFSKKAIFYNNQQIDISKCIKTEQYEPYTEAKNIWKLLAHNNANIKISNDYKTANYAENVNNLAQNNVQIENIPSIRANHNCRSIDPDCRRIYISANDPKFKIDTIDFINHASLMVQLPMKNYCLSGSPGSEWQTQDNSEIDIKMSSSKPFWDMSYEIIKQRRIQQHNLNPENNYHLISINCSKPQCDLHKYAKYNRWLRMDGSYFIDYNNPLDTIYSCGFSNKIRLEEEE
jgi:hypothetical protein